MRWKATTAIPGDESAGSLLLLDGRRLGISDWLPKLVMRV